MKVAAKADLLPLIHKELFSTKVTQSINDKCAKSESKKGPFSFFLYCTLTFFIETLLKKTPFHGRIIHCNFLSPLVLCFLQFIPPSKI